MRLIHKLVLSTRQDHHPHLQSCHSVFTHMTTPVKRPLDAIDSRHRSRPLALPYVQCHLPRRRHGSSGALQTVSAAQTRLVSHVRTQVVLVARAELPPCPQPQRFI